MALLIFLLPLSLFASSLSIATYNVQNLFDNEEGIKKISQIKKVIKAMGSPDFIGLQEVENKKILSTFQEYKIIVSKISDRRGMRVAFLFKKGKLLRVQEIPIKNSRSILEVEIKLKKRNLIFFINHWPSQRNPKEQREKAANKLIKRLRDNFIILGDFNLDRETNHLFDHPKVFDFKSKQGTYFYIPFRQWRVFDKILLSRKLYKKVKSYNYQVFKPDFITTAFILNYRIERVPWRFNSKNKKFLGYSDHLPVKLIMKIN